MTLLKNFKDFKELHGSIYDKCKEKNSTSNKVITLLDETRLDEMGVDDMSIRRNRTNWA